ncbi:MAG: hypothetical protein V1801_01335 [Candidatus Falkowbacteria bacterium]
MDKNNFKRKGGGAVGVRFVDEHTRALKILVTSSNQICLNMLEGLANSLLREFISSKSRVNHNGGMLMHFSSQAGIDESLGKIVSVVSGADTKANITVYNYNLPTAREAS